MSYWDKEFGDDLKRAGAQRSRFAVTHSCGDCGFLSGNLEVFQRHHGERLHKNAVAGIHSPCCETPEEHKWADPRRCLICKADWPCDAA